VSGASAGAMSTVGPDRGVIGIVLTAVTACLVIGLLPNGLQWLLLRRQLDSARRWLFVSVAGLTLGLSGSFVVVRWGLVSVIPWLTPEDFPSAKALIMVGAVTGLIYGAVTGPALAGRPTPPARGSRRNAR
jgi:hypothetical protein